MTITYAPPGTNGGKSSSSVSYATGSTTGTTTSCTSSFKTGTKVTASVGIDVEVVSLGADASYTASIDQTDSSSLEIKKSKQNTINGPGADHDGIDHGQDTFWLWLNPLLNLVIDSQGQITYEVAVDVAYHGPNMFIQYVYAKWLQNPALMPLGVSRALSERGLTTSDYTEILSLDPFHTPVGPAGTARPVVTTIDPKRYQLTPQSFPYEPPADSGAAPYTKTYNQTSTTTSTGSDEAQTQYSVSISASEGIKTPFTAKLSIEDTFTWTDEYKQTQTNISTDSATVTVGGPAFGYNGPTDVCVYWDVVYNSFMFGFLEGPVMASGRLVDKAGKAIAAEPVSLDVEGKTLSTFSNANGEYRFYGSTSGKGTVIAGGTKFPVSARRRSTEADVEAGVT